MARIHLSPPDIGAAERDRVMEVLDSNWVAPAGPHLGEFERAVGARVGGRQALAVNSGTAALHLAMLSLGVGPGDRVVCPSLTFAATAFPIRYCGAAPVFVDSEPDTWNADPNALASLLEADAAAGSLPKAVVAVHLYGQCGKMDRIVELCRHFRVPLVEDAAEALGAAFEGRPAGSFGDLAVFSFNGNKIATTSGGGMLLADDAETIDRARRRATQAREPSRHYEHREVGYNYRLSNLLAGLGLAQLEGLDERVRARREHFEAYERAFAELDDIGMMPLRDRGETNYWLSCIVWRGASPEANASGLIDALDAEDIEARPLWKPLHAQPVFDGAETRGCPVAEDLYRRGICLPSGAGMSAADRGRVIERARRFAKEGR